jgi:hypothetical protein
MDEEFHQDVSDLFALQRYDSRDDQAEQDKASSLLAAKAFARSGAATVKNLLQAKSKLPRDRIDKSRSRDSYTSCQQVVGHRNGRRFAMLHRRSADANPTGCRSERCRPEYRFSCSCRMRATR